MLMLICIMAENQKYPLPPKQERIPFPSPNRKTRRKEKKKGKERQKKRKEKKRREHFSSVKKDDSLYECGPFMIFDLF